MKKKNYFRFVAIAAVFLSLSAYSQSLKQVWVSVDEVKAKNTTQQPRKIEVVQEKFYQLNLESLKNSLLSAGDRENPGNVSIDLPNSDGELNKYYVLETPVMEPVLQAKYPNIRTYTGQGVDNPREVIKLSITPKGLNVMILGTSNGTQFIDPYSIDGNIYTVYSKKNTRLRDFEFECGVVDDPLLNSRGSDLSAFARNASDGILRDYRIAIACTGEYTTFHGGTVAGAMAAMVNTMNRVNGIYERDLSITMTMVDNTSIIFTDGATDPFNNNSSSILIGQSQTEINNAIGAVNYDIGHTFSTGAGGLAGLGVTCNNFNKARGVTGLSQPIGDPFDIDFVAHELGHQFGSPHTFNGNQGNCSGGNRSASSAYEPGSGTTIMAYAGICGSDNVQGNSDDYFHQRSLDLIWAHVLSTGVCPVNRSNTGNIEPTADAGSNFVIPGGTPYKLDGGGSTDPDGNTTLTYTWEQYDLGPSGVPTETTFLGPLVRSFGGTGDPTRYVPRLSDILNFGGVSTTWEKLATISRSINYRLTVRDNDTRGGQTDFDQMTITNVGAAGPFVVTSQATNQIVWTPGTTETITWNVAGTTGNGINAANVNILLSTDEGLTYGTVLASNVPNDGSHDITVPNVSAPRCRIMVEGAGNIFFNINDSFFAVGNYTYELTDVCEDYLFNANVTIVENAGSYTGYGLTVTDDVTISDLDVNVNITGTNNADIFHGIRGPFQTTELQQLASGVCAGSSNQDWTFDDEGIAINCGSTNNGDNVIPQIPLSFADGQSSAGTWVFFITDVNVDGTTSTLNSVTLTICREEIAPVLSIEENELDQLTIYPNPNNGEFNLAFNPKSGEDIGIQVYDMRGRLIYSKSFATVGRFEEVIWLNNAPSGVYLLNISDGSQKVTKKIIVE
ncbi:reprolysin-like metallopeptidase [Winogradskyella flava]|uniref:T9SS type A sorting domain-containing protein n=1 Tax=Winogradskyella flava TaxID=1884876 RepID=A0A842IR48_9FLAO|nr:zinc-dependent metalloprotease family protein [Winogradskyella flava]MBC2843937.1 T9SS type A sorting domain-containing protein [Winogradskyella flava]